MKKLLLILCVLLLGGCTQSGVHKSYDMSAKAGRDQMIVVNLDATTDTDTESGDAGISPQTSASLYGPSQVDGVMDDLKYVIEKWQDFRKEETTVVEPEPKPEPKPEPEPDDISNDTTDVDTINLDEYDIVAEAACDKTMTYRTPSESAGITQKLCRFQKPGSEYGRSFIIEWTSGNRLSVPDSANMSWDTTDFRKYQPAEPDHEGGYVPGTPCEVYAGRGDNSTKARILVKKM
jgi:hypothetical protein